MTLNPDPRVPDGFMQDPPPPPQPRRLGLRPWQLSIWQSTKGAPFFSLGVHVDLHTPTLDVHLPGWTVQVGRNGYWGVNGQSIDDVRTFLGGRIALSRAERWSGHTDNCGHLE